MVIKKVDSVPGGLVPQSNEDKLEVLRKKINEIIEYLNKK